MDRKEFITSVCRLGVCSCTGIALFSPVDTFADQEEASTPGLKQSLGFVQRRFAEMIKILAADLDSTQKNRILEQLGRSCSQESQPTFAKYRNDLEGFLNSLKNQWAEKIDYDKTANRVTIYGKKMGRCFCPLVDNNLTPTDICECSLGWQQNTFEFIIGRPVSGKLEESLLRGGQRCVFSVRWT